MSESVLARKSWKRETTYFSASARASSANSVMLLGSPTLLGGLMSCRLLVL